MLTYLGGFVRARGGACAEGPSTGGGDAARERPGSLLSCPSHRCHTPLYFLPADADMLIGRAQGNGGTYIFVRNDDASGAAAAAAAVDASEAGSGIGSAA